MAPLREPLTSGARGLVIAVAALASACSVGQGEGFATGAVRDVTCGIDEAEFDLRPSFFTADVIEDRGDVAGELGRRLTIRIQRGSFRESDSDGFLVLVRDANEIARTSLGVPIDVTRESGPVQMTLYLNETCPSGFPDEFDRLPLVLEAHSGTITFDRIYAADVDSDATEISAHFDGVRFLDPMRPGDREATLSGAFEFFYQRGRPAQSFP